MSIAPKRRISYVEILDDFITNENFKDLLENSAEEKKSESEILQGEIVAIDNGVVTVDVGLKTEGYINIKEFVVNGEKIAISCGDKIDVYLEKSENVEGKVVLSYEKAVRQKAWHLLKSSYSDGDTVEGVIFGRVKGGFTVHINGVIAFLPGSQVDIRPVKDVAPLMNIKQPFQILKMDSQQGNVIVSRKAILEEAREGERNEMLSKIKEGVVLDGIVKNITNYGAFIDLGSVDGLLHVTDIAWSKVTHPSEILNLGDAIKVKVIKFDENTKRISLGMKQLEANPWNDIKEKFPISSRSSGKVTNITDYGVFVKIAPEVEGLVHISEVSWTEHNLNPRKHFSIGQEVEVVVLDIDIDKHRIGLGIKQCQDNPWQEFSDKYQEGSVVTGTVSNIVDFGLFVSLEFLVDGLVHISDLSWDTTPEEELKKYNVGDKLEVKVLSLDVERERIGLGLKQMTPEVKVDFPEKGSIVTCVISEIAEDEGIKALIDNKIKAFIKRNDLSMDKSDQRTNRFVAGDKLDAKVLYVDKDSQVVFLSVKALEQEERKKAIEEYGSVDSGASLGDILGAALDAASEKKDKKDKKDSN